MEKIEKDQLDGESIVHYHIRKLKECTRWNDETITPTTRWDE